MRKNNCSEKFYYAVELGNRPHWKKIAKFEGRGVIERSGELA